MADNWTRNVVCRYYTNGGCYAGNNCRYRHIQGSRQESTRDIDPSGGYAQPCRYFMQGVCKYGDQCYFRHSTDIANSSSSHTNSPENTLGENASNTAATTDLKISTESTRTPEEWTKATEFVPSAAIPIYGSGSSSMDEAHAISGSSTSNYMQLSYAQAVNPNGRASSPSLEPLCPFAEANGICKTRNCPYLHGDICELCNCTALHPYNKELREKHTNACIKQHELDMAHSFAIAHSKDKSCGICFELILEKQLTEQRFGILPNCNHCFCLKCIRKWRQAKQFDNKIIRACPECRVTSDFVCPSLYWVDTKEEKEVLIKKYKDALSTKDCKHFNKGLGKCPFGNKCFYLHALPDGTKRDVGPPVRKRLNANADLQVLRQFILWEFFGERNDAHWYLNDFSNEDSDSDTDDSDDSELMIPINFF